MSDDSTPALASPKAQPNNDLLKRGLDKMTEKRDQAAGWLAAAFAAFNAGALATSLGFAEKLSHPALIAGLFAAALLLTFLTGAAFMVGLSLMWQKADRLSDLLDIEISQRDNDAVQKASNAVIEAESDLRPSIILGFAATITSLAGIVGFIMSCGLYDADNDARCLKIQHDMLSATPRRLDGPDLFQALGCRPQGAGSVYIAPSGQQSVRHSQ